jgi:anti-anti-sigma factor
MTKSVKRNIVISNRKGVCRIKWNGEADAASIKAFNRTAQALEDGPAGTSLVLDMENITYLDSASLSVFLRLVNLYRKRKDTLCVLKPRGSIADLFDYTGLSKLLVVCRTDEELKQHIKPAKVRKKAKARKK